MGVCRVAARLGAEVKVRCWCMEHVHGAMVRDSAQSAGRGGSVHADHGYQHVSHFSEWTDTLPPQRGQGNALSACCLCFYQNMIWPLPASGFSFLCVGVRVYNKKLPPAEKPESEGLFGSFLRLRVFHVCFSFSQQFRLSRLLSCVLNKAA